MDRKQYMREYQRAWIARRRKAWFDENGPCAKCGSSENLEADHINPETKLIQPRALWSMSDSNPRKIAELKKLQVLCEECHKEKSISELQVPLTHGDYHKGYGRGCKCDDCIASVAPHWRKYRARKGALLST